MINGLLDRTVSLKIASNRVQLSVPDVSRVLQFLFLMIWKWQQGIEDSQGLDEEKRAIGTSRLASLMGMRF